ncbi:hypothetical protein HMPREF9141_1913 [Prevotella multiformis DSM 16608]|uniref:Uncharacterized protein n=1 Tax=Prevotella multiformis DSM 16608 TaxID=888743 RepID=F0F8J6_9BACT|nr:hypothetical protein HMPREF9141_1913 [Prevotella multiformis DSM 16608]
MKPDGQVHRTAGSLPDGYRPVRKQREPQDCQMLAVAAAPSFLS